jgi:nicotinamide phosphoribosyltransferase
MKKTIYPAMLLCDFYKVSHRQQYPVGTEAVLSTWIPRSNKYFPKADKVVAFGIQAFIKKYLINYFNEHFFNRPKNEVVEEYVRYIKHTLLVENPDASHIAELHDLGYLPIEVKAVKEGTRVPVRVPMLTIENTHPKFFWVTNYLETIISNEIWLPSTSATIAYTYRQILEEYALKTVGNTDGVQFQGHDFSMRGMVAF